MSLRTSVATLVWQSVPLPGAPQGRRERFYPLSHFVTAPPEWEPRGEREKRIAFRRPPVRNETPYFGAYKPAGALWPVYHNFKILEFSP